MLRNKRYRTVVLIAGIQLLAVTVLLACPECKEVYAAGSKEAAVGESYSWSVMFMLGMFCSMVVGGVLFMRYQIRKHAGLSAAQM